MDYFKDAYEKLMKHAERFDKWAERQKKTGMAISRPSDKQTTQKRRSEIMENKNTVLKVGDVVYYRGLNWLTKTHIHEIYDDKIRLNNGVVRKISEIGKDVFLDKESANKTMVDVYKGRFI